MAAVLRESARPAATETPGPQRLATPPEPPAAKPRPSARVESPAPPSGPNVIPWTPADITPEASPATAKGGPRRLMGKAKGFASRAQWRKFFADPRLRRFAHRKAHDSKGGPKVRYRILPERKGPPSAETLR